MDSETARSRAEIVDEVSKWGVGGGILVTALAPLSLPILILTLVALLPLAVPVIAVGLLALVLSVPVMLVRRIGRSVRRKWRRGQSPTKPDTAFTPTPPEPSPRTAGEL